MQIKNYIKIINISRTKFLLINLDPGKSGEKLTLHQNPSLNYDEQDCF